MRWLPACLSLATITLLAPILPAVEPKPAELRGHWGDQGDGTFVNPILPADFSDLDVTQVGPDYIAISSTLHVAPGMVVLQSRDLVNWRIVGHAVPDVSALGPEFRWDRMNRYGRGVWAGAIRHHAGKFWVYFGDPDAGLFVTTATDPAGPWSPLACVYKTPGYDDPCPFWDDDGQGYLVTSHFATDPANGKSYNIHLLKLTPDGTSVIAASDRIIHQSRGSEANKLYKFKGTYYHYYSEVKPEGRVAMMNRASSLDGPWETRQLNHVNKAVDKEPNQGGFVQAPSGDWWFLTHHGSGDWEGRTMSLLPVTWKDGWPIIGEPGPDGIGNMVWKAKKPIQGPLIPPQTNDEFAAQALAPQWEWNHAPRDDKWSLSEREGFLRLHAFKPLRPGDLLRAGNTLSQRVYRTLANEVVVKLDLSGMADGQEAGLCHFARTYAMIGASQKGATRTLVYKEGSTRTEGPALESPTLYLKSTWNLDGLSQFSYSIDGAAFTPFGKPYQLTWGSYRGDRVGIYSFNDSGDAGHLDVDWFHYTLAGPGAKGPR
jgi:beta-xylosidase